MIDSVRRGLLVLSLGVAAAVVLAGPGTAYEVHLAIQSRNANLIQGRGVPLTNDIVGGPLGEFPAAGPHLIAANPTFYTSHQTKLTADLIATVPDPNFAGIIVMDYEGWWPSWEWTDTPIQDAWRNYIKTSRTDLLVGHPTNEWEGIFQAQFKLEVKNYYVFTCNVVRSLRPKAKITFYGLPLRSYWIFNGMPDKGVDLNRYRQIHENDLGWYFDMVDVLCPSIYPMYKVASPPSGNIVDPAANEAYILGMVSEAVRNSRGKPVFPFFCFKYHPSSGYAGQFVNALNLRQGLEIPRQAGAAGVAIWDFFYTDTELNNWQNFYDAQARDVINGVIYPGGTGAP